MFVYRKHSFYSNRQQLSDLKVLKMDLLDEKAFSHLPLNQAAENNKAPILQALKALNLLNTSVLEVGSGTGQHGIYFCAHMPDLIWQPTEITDQLPLLLAWHQVAKQQGVNSFLAPIDYSIEMKSLPEGLAEIVYCANVLHIIQANQARCLVKQIQNKLKVGQKFICYGPFKQNGQFTTESNKDFHFWLQQQGYGGLLDMESISIWSEHDLVLEHVVNMPANNFLLVWEKQG